ncbi:MAG TPA: hypothetical protein VGI70_08250, partial [Polyangiales bacterium]
MTWLAATPRSMPPAHPTFPSFYRAWAVGLWLLMAACSPNRDAIFALDQQASTRLAGRAGHGSVGEAGSGAAGSAGQAGGAPAAAGSAGASSPHLDPNVTFNWNETAPGTGSCAPQTMIGSFSCDVAPAILSPHVEGSLRMTFGSTSETQILPLSVGQLTAFDDTDQQLVMAPMTGQLDCGTNMATVDMTATMTVVLPLTRQLAWILPSSQPTMTGNLAGTFNDATQTMTGDVTLLFADTSTKC